MKLAGIYSIFNGLELLEKSIEQIEVDCIIIGWQRMSNTGNESKEIVYFVESMKQKHKDWYFVEFAPVKEFNTKRNELDKHNLLLNFARNLGCSHFLISATDHFYKKDEFIRAKEIAKDYDCTTTKMFTYYKEPTYQLTPIEDYEMLFICKIHQDSKFERIKFPVTVDPSLKLTTHSRFKSFERDEIMMHHYSMIRKDISSKFKNAAASVNWNLEQKELFLKEFKEHNLGDEITYFKGRKTIEVGNFFNL